MTLERRRPLPAGRYWLDVVPLFKRKWEIWRDAMSTLDSVKIEVTEHFEAVEAQDNPFGDGPVPAAHERDFVIFSLANENVAWGLIGLPSPTIAPGTVTSAADTGDVPPPPPTIGEQLQAAASSLGTGAKVGVGLGVAVVITIAGVALLKKR